MKLLRIEWPKVRVQVKNGNDYFMVDMRRAHYQGQKWRCFNNRAKALKFASGIGSKVSKSGLDSLLVTDPRLRAWTEQASLYGKTLDQIVALGFEAAAKERMVKESHFVAELLSVWLDDRITDKLKPLRKKSLSGLRSYVNIFKQDFGTLRVKELTRDYIEDYLSNEEVSNITRKNRKNYLGQFLNWCMVKGYHHENPCKLITVSVQSGQVKLFTVDQCQEIMNKVCQEENKHLIPYFAICLFGGVRPEEAEKLTWQHINLETKELTIPADISKTKKGRQFVMNDTLNKWLVHCKAYEFLIPSNVKNDKSRLFRSLSFKWQQDALRHTFASYHYATHKNLETLRFIMGNSPNVIEKFYRGIINEAEVTRFWNISPPTLP